MISYLKLIPFHYKLAIFLAVGVFLFASGYDRGHTDAEDVAEKDKAKVAKAQLDAFNAKLTANGKIADKQKLDNDKINKVKDEELAKLRSAKFLTNRMPKPGFCGGPTGPAQAESAPSSNGPGAGGGMVPEAMGERIQALILRTEEVAATARACQRFLTDNELTP